MRGKFKALFLIAGLIVAGAGLRLSAVAAEKNDPPENFSFVQLSDTHWGFNDSNINPNYATTLKTAIAQVNALYPQPDFVVFTGDLTQSTGDDLERHKRLEEFRELAGELKVKDVRFLPGEHDAAADHGAAFKEIFGKSYYSFDHKGVHFVVLDNVSAPDSSLGEKQMKWLADDLKKLEMKSPRIMVLTHRPLFDLAPSWDWATRDGAQALKLFAGFKHVTVFYGHIHQLNQYTADGIVHYAARGLMYPLPAPGSVPKKGPVAWNSNVPYAGLGFRSVAVRGDSWDLGITEYPLVAVNTVTPVISVVAKKYAFAPNTITLKQGVPVVLELTSGDVTHGFSCPDLKIRADINPGKISRIYLTPLNTGTFPFLCDIFCGEGHENMTGSIVVEK